VVDADEPGQIVGRVMTNGDQALADVEITVLGQPRAGTLSNQQGRFTVRDVEPGLIEVRFARLGYAPRTATLILQPGRTVEVAPTMVTQPIELEPIQVTVRSRFLDQNGFYQRSEQAVGTQFTAREIEAVNPSSISDVIRGRVPGVRIRVGAYGPAGVSAGPAQGSVSQAVTRGIGGLCVMGVYRDGVPEKQDLDLDQIPPEQIEAIEVFTGLEVPVQYSSGANGCGVILIWTRRGA
jgi:outer membrane receptor protein involved in Fe transport